jgi:ATP-dependent DNA helicase RecQ
VHQLINSRSETWLSGAVNRCRQALADATSLGDRLALIRSLTRLQDGRSVLADEGIELSNDEIASLSRFGLALTSNEGAIRLVDEPADWMPDGFLDAEALDSSDRSYFASASPDAALLRHSSHRNYKNAAQKAAIRALLTMPDGSGLMVSMATGSGKSLLFQLYAHFERTGLSGACVVVITPTIALALDHVRTLSGMPGLERSSALTGTLSRTERDELLASFRRGEIPVLFMSPEFALGAARNALIEAVTPPESKYAGLDARLKAIFIDEAHIVESWGRSFRPDFQRLPALLGELRRVAPSLRIVLLSATLPPAAKKELRRAYGASGNWLEIDARTPRYEFDLVVQHYSSHEERQSTLDKVVDWAPRPLIIYTTLVGAANELYRRLQDRGYNRVALFTGQTDGATRSEIVSDWANNQLDLVIATSAFGMGVDKSDVRAVIHACFPESPARWYQEIGRSARDGHQGIAISLFSVDAHAPSGNDLAEAYRQATGSWLTREIAELRWKALLERRSSINWNGSYQRMALNLDVVREGLNTRADNDNNRNWNRSLLNLLQRAGVLEIVSVSTESGEPGAIWEVEIRDPEILDTNNSGVWSRIFHLRDSEQTAASSELNDFKALMMQPRKQCLIHSVFDLIQADGTDDVSPCGRCEWCRKSGVTPPKNVKVHGLECAWEINISAVQTKLPPGITLISPDDAEYSFGLGPLLSRLVKAGIEQFIVPNELVNQTANALAESPVQFGLTLSHSEWVGSPENSLARLPTAVLLPHDKIEASELMRRIHQFSNVSPEAAITVVARPDRLVDDRRLDQTVSTRAPYVEAFLDELVVRG